MKIKIINGILIMGFLILLSGCVIILVPKVKMELTNSKSNKLCVEKLFNNEGHFYTFFYRQDCRYCDNVLGDIEKLASKENVIMVDSETIKDVKEYDWNSHEANYDVEIGYKTDNGKYIYYDGKNEKDIKDIYPPLYYKIVWANEGYAELNEGKEKGKIYAIYTHPILKKGDLLKDNFVLPAIPILMEFDNHQIINYYFDDKEIIGYLKTNTKPLDKYWNLN